MMKSFFSRFLIALLLITISLSVEAKKYHFEIKPIGETEALIPADSLAFLACPVFNGGKIECFPQNLRAMVADFNNEKEVEDALQNMKTYFEEHPLEGEYSITAGDLQAKKLVGCATTLCHQSAKKAAMKHEAKSLWQALLFVVLTFIFGFLTLKLFSITKGKVLFRILGVATGALTLVFGILGIIAVFALAFRYICIVLGCVLALFLGLSALGVAFGGGDKKDNRSRKSQELKGWVVDGVVYQSKNAADEAAKRTGSQPYYQG